ncbi:hypothetical protein SELMODRAFT_413325 [Selaginella moellendorffii]|uniref:Mitochondrial import inner membrane translocase subunit TIM22 n=1 Tax=Selaginella moellendorffii TaxID=88036 RepID=D8RP36_SELML|nr:outer envelope pore protein 16-2, chloroplastic [Selaginella moellendorffii]XP_002993391.1 outer envelope pore protein 16-2, chloroplastic [Selaginella moellendorffii]EFJ05576.1 hypothetical protein SELMODRAFT_431462 [Selaginella moellendorffii]EFJ26192.1 hypothetical protein SELMODRAFT_413325 [Selaginella moellendorffii]|eukprot:XP_002972971.1 outer envelope pore protein 16-2, chloroplastic [Selaginella moellendorffii]
MAGFGKGDDDVFLDLGHPVVNRSVEAFLKAGAVGLVHATSQIAAREAADFVSTSLNSDKKSSKCPLQLEEAAFTVGKQAVQWGLASGIYSSATISLKEARGVHDWKNAMFGGALAGAAVSLTEPNPRAEAVVSGALTGGAVAIAADFIEKLI